MNTHTLYRRLPVITVFMAVSTMAIGIGYAAWTANGSGTGSATAIEAVDLDIDPKAADGLYPNGSFDVEVTITNPNPYNVSVTEIDLETNVATDVTVDVTHANAGCDTTGIDWGGPFDYVLDALVVGATGGTQDVTLDDALVVDNTLKNECQGATFTIDLELEGLSTDENPTP